MSQTYEQALADKKKAARRYEGEICTYWALSKTVRLGLDTQSKCEGAIKIMLKAPECSDWFLNKMNELLAVNSQRR